MKTTDREGQLATLVERTVGRYKVTAFIGAGGMGEVYRARDTQLSREVALKILPESFASQPERFRRFETEARAVARLSHPNIMTIHDFGTEDGIPYAVMELLEGESLRQRLQRGPIPVRKAIDIASQIADGLSAAHHGGVIHRDIKPENVFLTPAGQVKILDFGVAHLREESSGASRSIDTEETITDDVQAAGTLAYMSPEQLRGQRVGAASDIFSLGCVLYEMLTGTRAFQRSNSADTVSAILHHDPPPITERRPQAPPVLAHLVTRCLEKQPGERFESARDITFALRDVSTTDPSSPRFQGPADRRRIRERRLLSAAVATVLIAAAAALAWRLWFAPPPPLPEEKHLAILPFEAVGDDLELEYLARGLTELLSDQLGVLEHQTYGKFWQVPARYRDAGMLASVDTAYRTHNATLVLTGQLFRPDGRLRLRLDLIDPVRDRPLRSAIIEDHLDNLVSFQQRPVQAVLSMTGLELGEDGWRQIETARTTVVPAFQSYLLGVGSAALARNPDDLSAAADRLEAAIELDPVDIRARCAFAVVSARLTSDTGSPDWGERGLTLVRPALATRSWRAQIAAARILSALDRSDESIDLFEQATSGPQVDAEALLRLGRLYRSESRFAEGEARLQKAINLRPDYWEGYQELAFLFMFSGRYDEAANSFRTAIRCAPDNDGLYTNLGIIYYNLGRYEDARTAFQSSLDLNPDDNYWAVTNLGTLDFEQARFAEAAEMFERSVALNASDYRVWGNLGHCYAVSADPSRAQEPFNRALELAERQLERDPDNAETLADVASYHAILGNRSRGLAVLGQAIATDPHDPDIWAVIGEAYEDLGERDLALEWIAKAVAAGIPPARFESHPSLRGLVRDPRFRTLTQAGVSDPELAPPYVQDGHEGGA